MKLKTRIIVEGEKPEEISKIVNSEGKKGRSVVKYESGDNFSIIIESDDVNAMRASVNSHLLMLKTIEKVNKEWKSLKK